MTSKFFALMTHLGAAKLAKATSFGRSISITQMAVGDGGGTLPIPDPAQTQLIHERRRAALNSLTIDPINAHQIIAEQVIPEAEGGWWIREIGLLDKDGDLVAIANCAETYKPLMQEGSGRIHVIRMTLIVSNTAVVVPRIDPSVVLATRRYVDTNAGDKLIEANAYADDRLSAHEKSRNHPDASVYVKGFTRLSSYIDENETLAATPKAVKKAVNAVITSMTDHIRTLNPHPQYLLASYNLFDLRDVRAAHKNLRLGSAATRNVGDANDNLMAVGAFGWGRSCISASAGINTLTKTGMYHANPFDIDIPEGFGYSTIQHIESNLGAHQLIFSENNPSTASARIGYRIRSNNQWREWVNIITAINSALLPIGVPIPYPGTTPPKRYLKCNGSSFYAHQYPDLATCYPDHKLPDLRGEFIRGWDDGRGLDTDRALLSVQTDAMQNITGGVSGISESLNSAAESSFTGAFAKGHAINNHNTPRHTDVTHCGSFDFDASRVVRTAAETRPHNMTFCYILRAS
ncbi:phage tail protein [Yersinia alsatica]|uniref:phage tail protein n=2 Tax=Yersinia alsatica TaxID=2890317 RepID=UPI00119DAF98|nr:phage tail protein [Yersinia alsatica]